MNILYVTYGNLSIGEGSVRSVSLLRALADAGHQVDVIAASIDLPAHPNIHILTGAGVQCCSRRRIRIGILRAMGQKAYPVIHAVDDAVLYVSRLWKFRNTKIVYEAVRCFSGVNGDAPSVWWKLLPQYHLRIEGVLLRRSACVFTSCNELTADLRKLADDGHFMQVEDIPAHPLFPRKEIERNPVGRDIDGGMSFVVVCCVLPGNSSELRTLLLAVRKIIEKIPDAGFFFRGVPVEDAQSMAANLDIRRRCIFLRNDQPERFLSALEIADAALFIPQPGHRYMHPEILTLLNSPALVVAVHEGAYSAILHAGNSVQVDFTATSIADGLLRVVQEPLLSLGMINEAQQLIADRYAFSSFKHKVRMAYHELGNMR